MAEILRSCNLIITFLCHLVTSLQDNHLIIAGSDFPPINIITRNSTGHKIKLDGFAGQILSWLSDYYKFTYSFLQVNEGNLDATENSRGLISYANSGECDVIIGFIMTTLGRIAVIDYTYPYLYTPVSYMMPVPDSTANIKAVMQPFQLWVWIGLFLSIALVSLVLFLLEWFQLDERANVTVGNKYSNNENKAKPETTFAAVIDFVLGTLLYQGRAPYCDGHKGLITRWVLTSWCLATLILSTAYSSVLISFVTSPFSIPFIDSIYNLEKYPGIILKTDVAYDLVVDQSVNFTGILKVISERVRDEGLEKTRCYSAQQCANEVKKGNIYVAATNLLMSSVQEDFKSSKKCNVMISYEKIWDIKLSFALTKNSPFLADFNYGLLKMRETGFLDHWESQYFPNWDSPCLSKKDSKKNPTGLSLNNMSTAFVVLGVGVVASLVTFVGEKIIFRSKIASTSRITE